MSNIELRHYYNSQSLDFYVLYYSDVKLGTFTLAEGSYMGKFVFNPVSDCYTLDEAEAILWAIDSLKEDKYIGSE